MRNPVGVGAIRAFNELAGGRKLFGGGEQGVHSVADLGYDVHGPLLWHHGLWYFRDATGAAVKNKLDGHGEYCCNAPAQMPKPTC